MRIKIRDSSIPGQGGGGGEYNVQTGFGWTNGVVLEFLNTFSSLRVKEPRNNSELYMAIEE